MIEEGQYAINMSIHQESLCLMALQMKMTILLHLGQLRKPMDKWVVKLDHFKVSLHGVVLLWHERNKRQNPFHSWREVVERFKEKFAYLDDKLSCFQQLNNIR
jgi:hypothetical protein